MHDLRLVGVHDDGEHLVLSNAEGQRFRLRVDDSLRAAVRRDRPHLGQLQIEKAGGLRPKDIQARIRAGATAEQIAAATDWPVERIRRYEGPVLAERAHIAEVAQTIRLRRRPAEQVTLGSEVTARLAARGVEPENTEWDAWRAESGPWTVSVNFTAGGRARQARWHFDLSARSVVSADDEARWLSEQIAEGDGPLTTATLAAVPTFSPDHPVYFDAADSPGNAQVYATADPVDLAELRSRRSGTSRPRPSRSDPAPTDVPGITARRAAPTNLPAADQRWDDPPAAHPAASERPAAAPAAPAALGTGLTAAADPAETTRAAADREPSPTGAAPAADPTTSPPTLPESPAEKVPAAKVAPPRTRAKAPTAKASPPGQSRGSGTANTAPQSPSRVSPTPATVDLTKAEGPGRTPARVSPAASTASVSPSAAGSEGSQEPSKTVAPKHRTSRSKRASVPSWDDIMFGTKRD